MLSPSFIVPFLLQEQIEGPETAQEESSLHPHLHSGPQHVDFFCSCPFLTASLSLHVLLVVHLVLQVLPVFDDVLQVGGHGELLPVHLDLSLLDPWLCIG